MSRAQIVNLKKRPNFVLVYRGLDAQNSFFGIVPKNLQVSTSKVIDQLVGQQVVQWEIVRHSIYHITKVDQVEHGSRIKIQYRTGVDHSNPNSGSGEGSEKLSQLYIPEKQEIAPISFDYLVEWANRRPLYYKTDCGITDKSYIISKEFDGCRLVKPAIECLAWEGGVLPTLISKRDSVNLLELDRIIVPNKEKFLHVNGTLFYGSMTVDESSPYSGYFAPGEYKIFGRLSSGMRDLNLYKEDGVTPQKNSLGFAFMVFKNSDQEEVPGIFLTQDTLNPSKNHGIQDIAMSNNPSIDLLKVFDLSNNSLRDIKELLFSGMGVASASLGHGTDSARGLRANYRSSLGMTRMGVDVHSGEQVVSPPFFTVTVAADQFGGGSNYIQYFGRSENLTMNINAYQGGRSNKIAKIHGITWLGTDSHEISFPHTRNGLGAIDPQTLRASFKPESRNGIKVRPKQ